MGMGLVLQVDYGCPRNQRRRRRRRRRSRHRHRRNRRSTKKSTGAGTGRSRHRRREGGGGGGDARVMSSSWDQDDSTHAWAILLTLGFPNCGSVLSGLPNRIPLGQTGWTQTHTHRRSVARSRRVEQSRTDPRPETMAERQTDRQRGRERERKLKTMPKTQTKREPWTGYLPGWDGNKTTRICPACSLSLLCSSSLRFVLFSFIH